MHGSNVRRHGRQFFGMLALVLIGWQSTSLIRISSLTTTIGQEQQQQQQQETTLQALDVPVPSSSLPSATAIAVANTLQASLQQLQLQEQQLQQIQRRISQETKEIMPMVQNKTEMAVNIKPMGCPAVLQRMHEWNDCWRHHVRNQQGQEHDTISSSSSIRCHVHTDSINRIEEEVIGEPFYHFAFYYGQGFGRVVAHTPEACSLAFLLGRPCLVNLAPRDPHYTWRSFFQANSYNWDPTLLHDARPETARQLDALALLLPTLGNGGWNEQDLIKYFSSFVKTNNNSMPLVFPMQRQFDRTKYKTAIKFYSGAMSKSMSTSITPSTTTIANNNTLGNPSQQQVLLSANWGDAWFTRIPIKEIFEQEYHCYYEEFRTLFQNAMYAPTDLARHLHQIRIQSALESGSWNMSTVTTTLDTNNKNTTGQKQQQQPSRILPHQEAIVSSSHGANLFHKTYLYGAIHVRLHFLNERRASPMDKGEIVTMVRRCFHLAHQMITGKKHLSSKNKKKNDKKGTSVVFPHNWWLLADDAPMAVDMAGGLKRRQQSQLNRIGISPNNPLFDPNIPVVNLYHNYTANITKKKSKNVKMSSEHSNAESARGLFGHARMAGSIQDWMALHDSQIAIVVHEGSFGVTGARGNGKLPRAYCGGTGDKSDKDTNPFRIFF